MPFQRCRAKTPAYKALRDYERQKKDGLDPIFDPVALGIVGATFWETRDPLTGKERVPETSRS